MSDDVLTPGGQVKAIGEGVESAGKGVERATTGISKLVTSISEAVRSGDGTRGKRAIFRKSVGDARRLFGDDVLSDEEEHALAWEYVRTVNGFENLNAVGRMAEDACRAGSVDVSGVDRLQPDWWDVFEDGASHAYDDEVRAIWAQLLAGEINRPGTFSKRTLTTLNNMSPLEAQRFRELCSWCFDVCCEGEPPYAVPLLAQVDGKGRTYGGFPLPRGTVLEDAGLVTQSTGRKIVFRPGPNAIIVNGDVRQVWNSERHTVCFMSGYSLTSTGRELALLCAHGTAEDDIPRLISERFENDMPTIGQWIVLNPPSGSSELVPSAVHETERPHLYR